MKNLGFQWDQVQDSVTSKRYNIVMFTYLIWSTKKLIVECHAIVVRPFLTPTARVPPHNSRFSELSSARLISSQRTQSQYKKTKNLTVFYSNWS